MTPDPAIPVPPTVLVVDDEPQIRRLLRVTLEANGYRFIDAADAAEGIAAVAQRRPDLVLLDLGLPDAEGIDVLRRIREWSRVPVVILSVRNSEDDMVSALDAGADDYVTKPFNGGELLARIRAAMRRASPGAAESVVRAGEIEIDLARRVVTRRGAEIKLTPIEYALLRLLATNAGRVLTHRQLLVEVWGPQAAGQTHYLRVHVAHLREKLGPDPAAPGLIRTEPAIGYRWVGATT